MTLFPQTQAIAEQIAQLKEQLNSLTASLEPYRECEQKAYELLGQISEHAQLMRDKGIEKRSLFKWADKIYYEITRTELEQSDSEAIKVFRSENESLIRKVEALEQEKANLHDELRKISISSVEATAKLSVCEKVNDELRAEILRLREQQNSDSNLGEIQHKEKLYSLDTEDENGILQFGTIVQRQDGQVGKITYVPEKFTGDLIVGTSFLDGTFNLHAANLKIISQPEIEIADTVKLVDACGDEDLEELIGRLGTVVGKVNNAVSVVFRKTDEHDEIETIVSDFGLRIVAKDPKIAAGVKIFNFVSCIKTKKSAEVISWEQIKEICQAPEHLRELALACTTKTQKDWFARLPELLADYINRTSDRADLNWINDTLKTKVEALLEVGETAA